ncbi:MAG: outer membrane protein assembly factor BamA [Candidatus Omnitrophota bacterium]
MRKGLAFGLAVSFCFLLSAGMAARAEDAPTAASAPAQKTIAIIKTRGNKAVSSATILSKIKAKPGDTFSQELLNADLKRLFGLGFFTDISIDAEDYETGVAVTFVVVEKPLISQVTFIGNKTVRSDRLKKEIKSVENDMLDEIKLNADMENLKTFFKKRGYQLVKATYKIDIDKEKNTAKVTVTIDENLRVKIRKIRFFGNKSIPSKQLLKTISTRPASLFTAGFFKEETFLTDIEKIKTFYENSGFLDVKVDPQTVYDSTGHWMELAIKIDEGKKYIVGDIAIKGNAIFPEKELRARLKMAPKAVFSQIGLRQDVLELQQFYFQKGYMLAQIDGADALNPKTGGVDVAYTVTENELIYIDKIKIKGNIKTKDVVIRRELRSYPGERFDGDKLRRSKERLYNLGYFEEVNLDTEPGSAPNKQNLLVNVKETKTGEFSFGGGFSSVESLIGFVSVTQKNFDLLNFPTFTGDGQRLRLSAEFGTIRKNYELSWVEPWILDFPLLFGFDLYDRSRLKSDNLGYSYDESRKGGDLRLGKEFNDYLSGDLMYVREYVKIGDVDPGTSADFRAEEGRNVLSKMIYTLSYDKRDNVFNPMNGYLLTGSVEEAGGVLGGSKDFMKYTSRSEVFFSFLGKNVLELSAQAGVANAYASSTKVPIYERFYLGGTNSVRGYRERRIGPKDAITNDPIGGEAMLMGSAEFTVPIYEKVIKGALFYDIGNVWERWSQFGVKELKAGTGVGVRVKTPIGPVKLDYGFPLSTVAGESKRGRLHFTLSQGF